MKIKNKIMSRLEKIPAFRKIVINVFNRLKLNSSKLDISSIHFKNNNIFLQKDNWIGCGNNSFLKDSIVYVEGRNNSIIIGDNTELYGVSIRIFGENNQIKIGNSGIFRNGGIQMKGNYNKVIIGEKSSSYNATFQIGENGNEVRIGRKTTMHGRDYHPVNFEIYEGSNITVGNDCMFSNGIQIHSSDSHSIMDFNEKRINPAEDIVIGNHCWICFGASILKGTHIPDHTVVGAGAVCTKKYTETHCVLAGNPAKVVKKQIDWDRKFL